MSVKVPDLQQATDWYTKVLGLVECERRNGRVYLKAPVSGRITVALTQLGTGLEYASCLVRDLDALNRIAANIEKSGLAITDAGSDSRTGAARAIRVQMPTEQTLEFLVAENSDAAKPSPAYPGAFNIEASHVQLRTPDVAALALFFNNLGFRVTDYGKAPDKEFYFAVFVRANEFHHQFALFAGKTGLHHIALETDSIDFLKIGDHFSRLRVAAEYGPGRHMPGDSIFLYVRDPFGNRIEITSPMQMVGFEQPAKCITEKFPFMVNMWGPQPPESWMTEWT
jgi:catechol 2,3-dioxygenase-like lactoylglutathione lyase family enzyme